MLLLLFIFVFVLFVLFALLLLLLLAPDEVEGCDLLSVLFVRFLILFFDVLLFCEAVSVFAELSVLVPGEHKTEYYFQRANNEI